MSDELLTRLDKRVANTGTEHPEAAARIRAQAARIAVLEEALRFYADLDNYQYVQASSYGVGYKHGKIHDFDRGGVAIKALRAAAGSTIYAARDEHVDALRGPLDAQPNYDPVAAIAYAQEMGLPTEFDPAADNGEVTLPWSKRVLETGRLMPDAQTPKNLAALLDHQNKIIADLRRELAESQSALDSWIKLGERALKGVTERAERAERERDAWEKRAGQYMDERDAAADLAREEIAKQCDELAEALRPSSESSYNGEDGIATACAEIARSTITDPAAVKQTLEDASNYQWLRTNRPVLLITGFFGNGCINKTISDVSAAINTARKGEEGKS